MTTQETFDKYLDAFSREMTRQWRKRFESSILSEMASGEDLAKADEIMEHSVENVIRSQVPEKLRPHVDTKRSVIVPHGTSAVVRTRCCGVSWFEDGRHLICEKCRVMAKLTITQG